MALAETANEDLLPGGDEEDEEEDLPQQEGQEVPKPVPFVALDDEDRTRECDGEARDSLTVDSPEKEPHIEYSRER
ncbi:hypothetical protein Pmar_PMAR018809 [Perkinsus marinus ATCC 50983]|uniref:Uncharacterized protein n=1 Tax=Perkinsus marinus (strain ATCC 50983 / TXsc) TaxID=423536 RepID=C5KJF2_PERM5|nr:hypothetical protein Pmar_PMAR018809 [Perkinsus marinus ATCC 50983]EER15454.1 hypothetical protein Pmar_PMAR018809 [Perkinsus marinus ATCC 50983]|eukprot:XP_002783658.1 hypothetical protein Pmar_PMAR018809 [Perkinsus marinus ATCC 50983]